MLFVDFASMWERIKRRYWFIESVQGQIRHERAIQIGYTGPIAARRPFTLRGRDLFTHKHIIGKTGYGKSNLILNMAKQLIAAGIGVALIDPHADLANDLLWSLLDEGYFDRPEVRDDPTKKLLYIDFDMVNERDETQYFLPLNILKQPYDKYKVARNVVEICRRVWPYLRDGAPQFENILLNTIIVLTDNDLPLTKLQKVLNEKEHRDALLAQVSDPDVVGFFKHRFDKWQGSRDAPLMIESTLNKATLLTFSPVLRYSLGQPQNALNFEEIINMVPVLFSILAV
jgi:Helicase HerA, central domain